MAHGWGADGIRGGRWLLLLAALSLFAALIEPAAAEEKITITSFTPTARADFLKHEGSAAALTATLYMPAKPAGPVPAIVLKHGSGGMVGPTGDNIRKWAGIFAGWGVAALVVDSFGPRKISDTAANQGQLSTWAEVADSFAALKVLGADPRIDKQRIAIVGWSRGGMIAMDTGLDGARKVLIADDLRFAAHIVFYGPAMTQFRDKATDGSPFLFLHGEADDYVPIGPTREWADWAKSAGSAVTFVSYPGAFHDFDVETQFQGFAKSVEVTGKCDAVINLADGKVLRMDHKPNPAPKAEEFNAYLRSCVTHGADLGYDAKARAGAIDKVHAFLKDTLAIKG